MSESDDEDALALLAVIDERCDRFERDWRAGHRPSVESIIESASDAQKSALLRYLLSLELSLRREAGETPAVDEFQERFPEYSLLIAETLNNHTNESTDRSVQENPFRTARDLEDRSVRQFFLSEARFDIINRIGEGTFSVVYRAWDNQLERFVALKIPRDGSDPHRFRTEVRSLARVEHLGIVQIYDVSADSALPFIVLEYVGGGDLKSCPELSTDESIRIVRDAAAAVAAAHDQQVLHRDLKPSNILLDDDRRPHVADFGLARIMDDAERRTGTGDLLGTIEYMAPEQASGQSGPQSDVYSLGVILFELLTGKLPAKGTRAQILAQLTRGEAAEFETPNGLHRDLVAICRACLALNPNERYPHAAELVAELDRFSNGSALEASSSRRPRRRTRQLRVVASSVIVVIVALLTLLASQVSQRNPVQLQFAHGDNWVRDVAVSPVEQLVVTSTSDGAIWLRRPGFFGWLGDGQPVTRVPAHAGGVLEIAFAPDGSQLATVSVDSTVQIWRMPECKRLHTLDGHQGAVMCVCYSPDGRRIATVDVSGTIRLWDRHSGELVDPPIHGLTGIAKALEFLPDGQTLVYVGDYWRDPAKEGFDLALDDDRRKCQIQFLDVSTGQKTVCVPDVFRIRDLAFSPAGRIAVPVSGSKGTGAAVLMIDPDSKRVEQVIDLQVLPVEVSFIDEVKLAIGDFHGGIHVLDIRSEELLTCDAQHTDAITEIVWSNSMNRLLSTSFDGLCVGLSPFWAGTKTE